MVIILVRSWGGGGGGGGGEERGNQLTMSLELAAMIDLSE